MKSNTSFNDRSKRLIDALTERILVLDGAMGTAIQELDLKAEDFGGEALEGCNENLVFSKPETVQAIHEGYLKSGCDIVETNTFGSTPVVLDEYDLGSTAEEQNRLAAELARKAVAKFDDDKRPRFVAGSMGPTTKAITVTGGITFEELVENYRVQARGLIRGGSDYLLLETCQDTRNVKAGFLGIEKAFEELGEKLPIAISVTIEPMGTMLAGQSVEALWASVSHHDLLYVGLNCATGPEFMTDHIRSLAALANVPIACVPNAGLPDENGQYLETPEMVAKVISRFVENDWINLVGGCCGTTSAHIQALDELAKGKKPRNPVGKEISCLSGIDFVEITDEMRPVIVGERTNVIGSRKFKRLITEEKFDESAEIARAQIKKGAQIIDVCLANPDRDEFDDMKRFLELISKKVKVPFMIDSTDEKVIEMSLTYSQGKAIINSINLEDGEERFEKVLPIARRYGAALVVGTIDDDPQQGMGVSRERKLAIAERSYKLLTEKYGIAPEDIYWDPLVFPCATGDEQYVGSAVETIEGVRIIKERFPKTKTVLGISNVSFGLPNAGREVLNSVFLYHCVKAGLDLAIVNSQTIQRYASIPKEEIELAENLLFTKGEDPIAAFADHFRERKVKKSGQSDLPLNERLPNYIIEGTKDGLIEDLELALKDQKPLAIINGPLMAGMDEVGRLFNENKLIVAEVLQSAEAMKAAVSHLEPLMDKNDSANRGKVLLATVKGDVHDIGKNLVEIVLANNGFDVVNLGIKVLPETLIQAIRKHNPDIVGLSGLLVKSAQQMVVTAEDFTKAGVETPILVGGAALSENFVGKHIAKAYEGTVAYASDAMEGLDLAKTIVNPEDFEALKKALTEKQQKAQAKAAQTQKKVAEPVSEERSKLINRVETVPTPPDLDRHVIKNTPIDQIWNFINPLMLYGRHLGVRGKTVKELVKAKSDPKLRKELEEREPKAVAIWDKVEEVKDEYRDTGIMNPSAVYQFFRANSRGNSIFVYDQIGNGTAKPVAEIKLPRQKKENGLCLSDYLLEKPNTDHTDQYDHICLFATTVGKGVREISEQLKNRGDYLKSHVVQVLALESAEGYAEYLHSQIRKMWGHPDTPEMTMMERFQAKYMGKRYSFGYPACPRLEDQKILFDLIQPQEVGIQLTDGFMMDPEASVSAICFHHPEASYFSVGHVGAEEDWMRPNATEATKNKDSISENRIS